MTHPMAPVIGTRTIMVPVASDITRPRWVVGWIDRRSARNPVNRACSTRFHRAFGLDADASDGDDEFSILIAKVGDAI
jgi:hypothetical protein